MGRKLTASEETRLLQDTVRAAHEALAALNAAIKQANQLQPTLVAEFEQRHQQETRQLTRFLQAEMNRHAAALNTDVDRARKQIVTALAASQLEYNEQDGTISLLFPNVRFNDNVPLPHTTLTNTEGTP